jgi:hypothetical protein
LGGLYRILSLVLAMQVVVISDHFSGFVLMEIGKSREEALHGNQRSRWRIARKVARGILTNPVPYTIRYQ